jgi:lipopolysaccharide export system permease protein
MTFFIAIFILLMQFLWKWIDELVGKGLEWYIVGELMTYASITLIPMALPLAILLSSIMTFGNLGENYELVALKSAGISLFRIMAPLIFFIGLVSIGAFYFSNYVMPYTYLKMSALLFDIRQQSPELSIKEGAFFNDIDGYSIKVAKKDHKTGLLRDIMVYDHTSRKGNIHVTIADSGYMNMSGDEQFLILDLYHGYTYLEANEEKKRRSNRTYPFRRDAFEEQKLMFQMDANNMDRTDEGLFKKHYQVLNLKQLNYSVDSLDKQYKNRQEMFGNNLLRTNYFKKESKRRKTDTIAVKVINEADAQLFDSLFQAIDIKKKEKMVTLAQNFARSAKGYIESSYKDLNGRRKWIRKHEIEWHRKFTLSFACVVLFFIGAPLGAIIRKGGLGMPVVVSVLFFILYYIISITGEKFVREDVVPAYQGMWLSSAVLLPLGIFLAYKAATDSVILSVDSYLNIFKKLFKRNGDEKELEQ